MRHSQQCCLWAAFKGSELYPIIWFWFVYFLECYLGHSDTFPDDLFIQPNQNNKLAKECSGYHALSIHAELLHFYFLLKKVWNIIRQENLCLNFRTQTVLILVDKWRPFSITLLTLAVLVYQLLFCSWSLRHIFCLSLYFGEPWGHVWVQCSQLRTRIDHVGNLSASSGGPTRVGKTDTADKISVPVGVAKWLWEFLGNENTNFLWPK